MLFSSFRLRGFRRLSDAILDTLGELERKTLDKVRRRGESSVGNICDAFDQTYAYTTLMTTLDRLYKKGLLERRKEGRAFFYSVKYTVEEMERGVAEDVIGHLLEPGGVSAEPVLACFVDRVSERDLLLLDELERLVAEKRRKLGQTSTEK